MKLIALEYLTPGARVWRRASVTRYDTAESRSNMEREAALLAVYGGWVKWRVVTC